MRWAAIYCGYRRITGFLREVLLPMAVLSVQPERRRGGLFRSEDLAASPEEAFALICEIEKWPVWLSFLHSARRASLDAPLELGAEVILRSAIPGEAEELYEVDRYLEGYALSLVGAYSIRRRLDFRIERKTSRSKIIVTLDYPAYGGMLGSLVDRLTTRRRLEGALGDSLVHFKGLVEYARASDESLVDF